MKSLFEGKTIWKMGRDDDFSLLILEMRAFSEWPTMRSNDIAQLFLRSSSRTGRTASLAGVMLSFVGLWRLLELRKQVIVFATG